MCSLLLLQVLYYLYSESTLHDVIAADMGVVLLSWWKLEIKIEKCRKTVIKKILSGQAYLFFCSTESVCVDFEILASTQKWKEGKIGLGLRLGLELWALLRVGLKAQRKGYLSSVSWMEWDIFMSCVWACVDAIKQWQSTSKNPLRQDEVKGESESVASVFRCISNYPP